MELKSDNSFIDEFVFLIRNIMYDTYTGDTIFYQSLRYAWIFLFFSIGYNRIRITIIFILWPAFLYILFNSYQSIFFIINFLNIGCKMTSLFVMLKNMTYTKTKYYHHKIQIDLIGKLQSSKVILKEKLTTDCEAYNDTKKNKVMNNENILSTKPSPEKYTSIKVVKF